MLEIQVTIKAPELSAAVKHLAAAVAGQQKPEASVTKVTAPKAQPEAPKAAEPPKAPEAPKAVPTAPAAPKAQPTAYTLDTLSGAMAKLIDDGKMDKVIAAIQSHGVSAINQLPETEYPAFAEDLKKLGAEL